MKICLKLVYSSRADFPADFTFTDIEPVFYYEALKRTIVAEWNS